MTTVPWPDIANTRSIGRRVELQRSAAEVAAVRSKARSSSRRSSSRPCPVTADTGTIAAPARSVPARRSRTSSATSSSHSASTMSALVTATTPCRTPRRFRMSRCSSVWGITPSSAATTKSATSTPVAPASMFLMNRSWPGTSTTPAMRPDGSVRGANPSSIVRPRSCSWRSRSVLTPVSARIKVVLPWSTWPAVPITACLMRLHFPPVLSDFLFRARCDLRRPILRLTHVQTLWPTPSPRPAGRSRGRIWS